MNFQLPAQKTEKTNMNSNFPLWMHMTAGWCHAVGGDKDGEASEY